MMKQTKKLICLLLSCILVLQLLPISVFAMAVSDNVCGGGVTWHLDGDVLYIEGEGEMWNFLNPNDGDDNPDDNITYAPWSDAYISKIVIGEGITYIGEFAFYEEIDVVEMQLPSTLDGIGRCAFAYMESLEKAILPEGLTTMGEGAFKVCRSLTTVSIPSTLKVIPYSAFWHCKSLTDLTISEGVEEIGEGAFDGCSGLDAESDGGDSLSTKFDGPGLKRVEIPGSVKTIGDGAFVSCTMLHELILHEGIEHIGSGAFQNCDRIYDITLPASLKTMGEWVFRRLGGYVDYELESMGIPVTRLQNVYILSRELSLKATTDYGSEMMWFDDWKPFAVFHVYEDSVAAQEIAEYNEGITDEYTSALNYSYIPDCGHELGAFVSDDENTHTRTCVDENCTASQTVRHTLTVDFATLRGGACDVDTVYQLYCTACDYVGEVVMTPAEGHKADYFYYEDEEYHSGYCDNCWEEFFEPHNWEYEKDLSKTEPYEVEAYCADCGTTEIITAFPEEATVISVKAKNVNGDDAALSEDSFAVRWEDGDGNVLCEGTTYVHEQIWEVTQDTPVFAVISFSDELRKAFSVSEEIRHEVTQLGQRSEFVLVPRQTLTVTGRVTVDGYTYLPENMVSLTLTTEIAGNKTVQTVTPDNNGNFTAQISRAPTRLEYSSLGYESIKLDNVQMMPASGDVIDVGTLTLVNRLAWSYPTVAYDPSYYSALASKLVGASLNVVNERTGKEYIGAVINEYDDYTLAVDFGMDMFDYFKAGDRVTARCAKSDEITVEPFTFTITRVGEQTPLDISLYKTPKLEIKLDKPGHFFIFDSENNLVFDGLGKTYSGLLPRGEYTYVVMEQSYKVPTIDSPDALEKLGVPTENYLRETVDLTESVTREYKLPQFYYGGNLILAATFDTTMQTDGLVPMYLNFNHIFKESYEEGETIELTFSTRGIRSLPIQPIQGSYSFGSDELELSERIVTDKTDTLVVKISQPRGRITLFVKPTGELLDIIAKTSMGNREYLTLVLPEETSVTMVDPAPSGWTTNTDHFVTLYAKLSQDKAPYTGYLYVNGELETEQELKITGEGRNYLHYTLERYADGASTHDFYVEIVDKDGELVWVSDNYMVTLVDRTYSNTVPQELTIRSDWQAGDVDSWNLLKKIDLQKNPGGSFSVPVNETKINADGTLMVDTVFDYALRMSDNKVAIKDNAVYMKVFCSEDAPTPTIHDVKLRYNGETGTYDGSLTLEAGTYTIRDLPYGYSFDYSMGAGGGSGFVPVGSAYATSYSVEQLADEVTDKANAYLVAQQYDPYEYFDPDELEFFFENTEDLTDEEKLMLRTLFSIGNDFYDLQESLKQSGASITSDIAGAQAVSDSLPEAMQGIVKATGDEIVCESVDPGIDYSEQDYTRVDTSAVRTGDDTMVNDLYLDIDEEIGTVTTIDPNSNLKYTVDCTMTSPDYAGASFESLILMSSNTFFGAATSAIDVLLDATKETREYFSRQILKKLGQQIDLEGDISDLEEGIAKWQDSLEDLWTRGVLSDDKYTAAQKVLDDIKEIENAERTISELEDTLKSLRKELEATKRDIQSLKEVAGQPFNKYNRMLNKLDSGPAKWLFRGLDVYSLLCAANSAVSGFNRAISFHNNLVNVETQAERMKGALTNACPTDQDAYTEQFLKCTEACEKLMEEITNAKDWNDDLLRIKLIQVFSEMLSIAAGHVLKGPQGAIASLGIGIVTGGSEWFILEKFNASLEKVTELQRSVSESCLEPLLDDSVADADCGEGGDGEGGDGDGSGAGSGAGSGENFTPMDPKQKPKYPICARPTIDPAGYVYEAVASNRIEGATAKIYYEENGTEVYWSDAGEYGEINPQITGIDGRFAWMTPIGNWRVKVEMDGYLPADSKNDPAAVNGWLPVPPPQLDVNIAMISTAAPEVLSVGAASDQIRVVFSQYMDIAQMEDLVTVTQNGQPILVDILFEDAEVSPANAAVYYGRIMKLTRTDGAAFSGDGIVVTVDETAKNYADKTLVETYVSEPMTAMQMVGSLSHSYPNRFVTDISKTDEIAVQVLDTNGKPMAGVTVTARQKVGGTLEMNESAVSDVSGRAVFTVKGLSAGSDIIIFAADVVSTEMNTRVSPLGSTVPQKPEANLSDYKVVEEGTQLILTYPGTEDVVIYYTTNNTCPCSDENDRKIYDGPITITEDTFFRIAAWTEAGGYSERLNLHIRVEDTTPISFSWNDGTYTVTRKTFDNGVSVLVASYEDSKMVKVEYLTVEDPTATLTGDNVKVFFLDDETYAPTRKAMELQP